MSTLSRQVVEDMGLTLPYYLNRISVECDDPNSKTFEALSNALNARLKEMKTNTSIAFEGKIKDGRRALVLTCALNPTQFEYIKELFPEFIFNIEARVEKSYSMLTALLIATREYFLTMTSDSKDVIEFPGDHASAVMKGRLFLHTCCIKLDAYELTEVAKNDLALANALNQTTLSPRVKEALTTFRDDREKFVCQDANVCTRPAGHVFIYHPKVDISVYQVGEIMLQHNASSCYGMFLFDPNMLIYSYGGMPKVEVEWHADKDNDQLVFMPKYETSCKRTFRYRNHMELVAVTRFQIDEHVFSRQITWNKDGVWFYRMQIVKSTVPRSLDDVTSHKVFFPDYANHYIITVPRLKNNHSDPSAPGSYSFVSWHVPRDLYDAGKAAALKQDKLSWTDTYGAVLSRNERRIVNMNGVYRLGSISPIALIDMTNCIMIEAYKMRWNNTEVMKIIESCFEGVRKDHERWSATLLGMVLLYNLKHTISISWDYSIGMVWEALKFFKFDPKKPIGFEIKEFSGFAQFSTTGFGKMTCGRKVVTLDKKYMMSTYSDLYPGYDKVRTFRKDLTNRIFELYWLGPKMRRQALKKLGYTAADYAAIINSRIDKKKPVPGRPVVVHFESDHARYGDGVKLVGEILESRDKEDDDFEYVGRGDVATLIAERPAEVVVQEHKAPPVVNPMKIVLGNTISAPSVGVSKLHHDSLGGSDKIYKVEKDGGFTLCHDTLEDVERRAELVIGSKVRLTGISKSSEKAAKITDEEKAAVAVKIMMDEEDKIVAEAGGEEDEGRIDGKKKKKKQRVAYSAEYLDYEDLTVEDSQSYRGAVVLDVNSVGALNYTTQTVHLARLSKAYYVRVTEREDVQGLTELKKAFVHRLNAQNGGYVSMQKGLESVSTVGGHISENALNAERRAAAPVPRCENPKSVIQTAYDAVLPGAGVGDYSRDARNSHEADQNFVMSAAQIKIDMSKVKPVVTPKSKASNLRTGITHDKAQTLHETIAGLIKRNLNSPEVATSAEFEKTAWTALMSFFETFCVSNWKEKLLEFKKNPVIMEKESMERWTKAVSDAKIGAISDDDLELLRKELGRTELHVKPQVKPTCDGAIKSQLSKVQTILAHSPDVTAGASSVFSIIRDRLLSLLKPEVLVNMMKNPEDIEKHINDFRPLWEGFFLECDFSQFDKSQQWFILRLEWILYQLLGLDPNILVAWKEGNIINDTRGRCGIYLVLILQRRSGTATTALGNTVCNMIAVATVYKLDGFAYAMFIGDDSIIRIPFKINIQDVEAALALNFNLLAKTYLTKHGFFCSAFLVETPDGVRFMTDPVKRWEKLGKPIKECRQPVEETWQSFRDLLWNYHDARFVRPLANCVSYRYGEFKGKDSKTFTLEPAIMALSTCAKSEAAYNGLFEKSGVPARARNSREVLTSWRFNKKKEI